MKIENRSSDYIKPYQLFIFTAQLALILAVAHIFKIEENNGILKLTPLLFGGFIVHALLPLRLRPAFFLLISLYSIVMFLGLKHGGGMIVLGLGLIGICHIPIRLWARVVLLLAAAAFLALVRSETIATPWWGSLSSPVIPMLSIMFMFRIALYLHATEFSKQKVPITRRLSYFYLLPSLCFPLCPVMDFNNYCRTYYDKPAAEIYQKGMRWMLRGMFHLILYRLVYHYMTPMANEVQDLGGTVQFAVASYLLYLRVSGLFHLFIGILCLFGYNLPETHRLYYFASSFTDFWRRINIYWKDFMMTLVYYPIVMRVRRYGMTTAIAVASVVTLVLSWILHSYQFFWLRGQFHLGLQDALFWSILGVCVAINALMEYKTVRPASLKQPKFSLKSATLLSAKTVLMLTTMTTLWSFWTADSIPSWWSVMKAAGNSGPLEFLILGLALLGLVGVGVVIQLANERFSVGAHMESYTGRWPVVATVGFAIILIAIAQPRVHGQFGTPAEEMFALVASEQMNLRDENEMTRGYYEDILVNENMAKARFINLPTPPADWVVKGGATRPIETMLLRELKPLWTGTLRGAEVRTNQWGMRDLEYQKEKPEGTFRVVILGASHLMGAGVNQEEDFESLIEKRLNEENSGALYANFEVLNFGLGSRSLPQSLHVLKTMARQFDPDMVMYVEDSKQQWRAVEHLSTAFRRGSPLEYAYLESMVEKAQVNKEMSQEDIMRRLAPYGVDLVEWSYAEIAKDCQEQGLPLVWFPMPRTQQTDRQNRAVLDPLAKLAEENGFMVLNIDGVYGNRKREKLFIAPWDNHPNEIAHQLLADAFYEDMRAKGVLALMGFESEDAQ